MDKRNEYCVAVGFYGNNPWDSYDVETFDNLEDAISFFNENADSLLRKQAENTPVDERDTESIVVFICNDHRSFREYHKEAIASEILG